MQNLVKKLIFIVSLAAVIPACCLAQTRQARVIVGIETGGSFSVIPKRNLDIYDRYRFIRTAPYLDVKTAKNFYTGLNYEIETGQVNGIKTMPLTGFGAHVRYFFPLYKTNPAIQDRFQFYGEVAFILLDHVIDRSVYVGVRHLSGFSNLNTQLVAGSDIRLFNSFYLNFALRPMFFTQGKKFLWSNKVGFEYHFGEQRAKYASPPKQEPAEKPHQAPILDIASFLKKITIGTSLTYLSNRKDGENNLPGDKEWTWNINVAASITSDIDVGLAVLPIWTKTDGQSLEKHLLTGVFTQYDFLRQPRGNRFFLETGLYRGNLCTCGDGNSYYRANLTYIPVGGGFEKRLFKSAVFLDLSILFYQIITKIPDQRYAYGQYVIGLNYQFYQ